MPVLGVGERGKEAGEKTKKYLGSLVCQASCLKGSDGVIGISLEGEPGKD